MGNSKPISVRIPDELLEKIDLLAEEKYKSHKGTPNRSLVVLDAIVAYFDTLSDTSNSGDVVSVSDNVNLDIIQRIEALEEIFSTLSDTVNNKIFKSIEDLREKIVAVPDTVDKSIEVKTKAKGQKPKQLSTDDMLVTPSTSSDSVNKINEFKIDQKLLARRLGYSNSRSLYSTEVKSTDPEFTDWSSTKDPDGIPWKYCKDGRSIYFIPSGELSDELKSKLLKWMEEN